jgi:hypothetical protein
MNYSEKAIKDLIKSSKKAVEELILEIEEPIDKDISQEKRRAITRGKREAFDDCQAILLGIQKLEVQLGEYDDSFKVKEEKDFKASFIEKMASKK